MPDKRAPQSKANGAKANGPKTPEGLAACQVSGGKHGNRHNHSTLHATCSPSDPMELQLADELTSRNCLIKCQYSSRNDELVRAYEDTVQHATPGMTTQYGIALAGHEGVGSDGRTHSHTKASLSNVRMRNRVFSLLCKLNEQKNAHVGSYLR